MLSQNVAKVAVPSYYMIRTSLPQRKPQNQWEGVYYYSGTTRRQQHVILLQRKRERMEAIRAFNVSCDAVRHAFDALVDDNNEHASAAHKSVDARFALASQLAQHGLHEQATHLVNALQEEKALCGSHYIQLVGALAADRLRTRVLYADAMDDPALTYKLLAEEAGEARAAQAYRWYDMGLDVLRAQCMSNNHQVRAEGTAAASQLTNALMRTLLTCGFSHVQAVSHTLYDTLGRLCISPTMRTYEHVLLSLCLQGNTAEAEHLHRYLRHRHGDQLTIRGYNALLLGHRECHSYDRCDEIWRELVDARWPRANPTTAELYLRSIVDHSYTPVSAPLRRLGEINVVEKKKVPMVLSEMDSLGIPRSHLSRYLMDEVEDALRKFSIYKSRFYEWGRAVKQFDFIEFRRRHGWLYDIHIMKDTTKQAPPTRAEMSGPDDTPAAAATAELPAFFSERNPWERDALEEMLYVTTEKERTEDVRAGDVYYDDRRSIHERSSTWMNEVPQTRYDRLYGVNQPDVAKIGIRRLLDVEYVNRKEVMERDAALTRKTLSTGRRLRRRVETARTHRNEGSLTKVGEK